MNHHITANQSANRPRIAAAVVTFNRRDMLRRVLTGLLGQRRPLDEIVVVDNASSDGTASMMAQEFLSSG